MTASMQSATPLTSELLQTMSWAKTSALALAFLLLVHQARHHSREPNVIAVGFPPIPLLGPWVAAIRFMLDPVGMVRKGMAASSNGMFRIATLQGEYVLVADPEKVTEYLKAPDSVLNAQDGANDQQQLPHTMGYGVAHRTYHTAVVRGPITKDIVPKTPMMVEEVEDAFTELIGSPQEYTPVALYDAIAMTVARVSSRVYVGTGFCRNEAYLQNAADYAQSVVISAEILRLFPEWSKSIVVRFLPVTKHRRIGLEFLGPYIQDRLDGKPDANGQKPDDLVQRLIDAAPPIEKTVPQISERVMALNVASIHTTTMIFTAALYTLAAQWDKYAAILRQEVLDSLEGGPITADSIKRLPKMDSFLRESGRFNVAGLMSMQRNARQDFTFSDGTRLPAGSKVGAPSLILHRDAQAYDLPDEFDGFRFLGDRCLESKENSPVTTSRHFHVFGHGRHPCPGRFFAVHEMKLMFCELLMRYDFKLAEGETPHPLYIATMAVPDTSLKVLFKVRS